MFTPLLLTCALVGGHPTTDLPRGGSHIGRGIGIGIGVGIGVELGRALFQPRHCDAYYADPCHYPHRTVYVQQPVYIERPVYVARPVDAPPPAYAAPAQPVVIEKVVERPVTIQRLVERDRVVESGRTTTYEKVDGRLVAITHGTPAPAQLDDTAEMAALCNVRDEINRLCPLSLARITDTGAARQVEVILRATRFAPYDRVTRRFMVNVDRLEAVGTGLVIRFNNTPAGIRELAGDFKAQLKQLGEDCAKIGGDWYLDDQFQAEPKLENGKKLTAVVAGL